MVNAEHGHQRPPPVVWNAKSFVQSGYRSHRDRLIASSESLMSDDRSRVINRFLQTAPLFGLLVDDNTAALLQSDARSSPHPSALFRPCLRPSERVPARSVRSKSPPGAPRGGLDEVIPCGDTDSGGDSNDSAVPMTPVTATVRPARPGKRGTRCESYDTARHISRAAPGMYRGDSDTTLPPAVRPSGKQDGHDGARAAERRPRPSRYPTRRRRGEFI